MKKFTTLLLGSFLVCLFACQTEDPNTFSIKANLDGIPDSSKVQFTYIDSTGTRHTTKQHLHNGTFEFSGPKQNYAWFALTFTHNSNIIKAYSSMISNEHISITGSLKNMTFKGSDIIDEIDYFESKTKKYNSKIDHYFQILDSLNKQRGSEKFNIKEHDSIYNLYSEARVELDKINLILIKEHPTKRFSTLLLASCLDNASMDEVKEIDSLLSREAKSIPQYKKISAYINTTKHRLGDIAHNFEVLDLDNEPRSIFKDRNKDKYLILDFSAIGCTPCGEAKSELNEIKELFNEKIDITTILFKSNREQLNSKILTLGNKWDFYRMSPKENPYEVEFKYHIIGKPQFVLINPEKKIEYIWPPGYKEGLLLEKVEEILNK